MEIEKRFIFFPEKRIDYTPKDFGYRFEDVYYLTKDNVRINAWFVPAGEGAPTIIFCHGNAGNISHRIENITLLVKRGISVFIFDYRGFGNSGGKIAEEGLYLDALGAYDYLTGEMKIPISKIVPFGRSMGGPIAVDLASRFTFPCLILESTFTSLKDMVRSFYPMLGIDKLLTMKFNSEEKIRGIKFPVLFIHGDSDEIVSYDLGRRLFDAANEPKTFYTIEGAMHNDTFDVGGEEYFNTFVGFINEHVKE
ncbi:MAG: alpha/beta hydrolase [Deltaproteobacteria bacterium]|uniref:Alpha/beta hydrolase n=1 Tax=Candidatus Zymogenus saltonus TaxID=2844893 RepID=A0A9D8KE88_9DELT|nr:alpha/beta hydrolase [Candidatus Zymogenus saltonus]